MRPFAAISVLLVATTVAVARPANPPAIDYDALARDLVAELNRVRTNPKAYAAHLVERRRYFDGKLWNLPDRDPLRTKEGVAALDDALRALKRAKRAKPLTLDEDMSHAAADHVADIGPRGVLSHDGDNGSDPFARLARYGLVNGVGSENIGVAFRDARLFVIHQLVDDGIRDRGHRKNILDPRFRRIGIACGPHRKYNVVCVMDFADKFTPAIQRPMSPAR